MTVTALTPEERLIWSADVPSLGRVLAAVRRNGYRYVKIDRYFFDSNGRGIIASLNELGVKVFADAKLIEVPSKLEALAKLFVREKPATLNCMAGSLSTGEMDLPIGDKDLDGLRRFAYVCNEADVMPVGVTVLTSKRENVVLDEFGRGPSGQALFYVEKLVEAGFGGVVCSPQEVAAIRRLCRDQLEVLTPGVRLPGGDTHDQARVDTPGAAIAAGATRVVSGRELTEDIEGQNYNKIVAEIAAATQ